MILRNGTRDSIKQSGARVPYRAQEIRKAAREDVEGEAAGWSGGGAGARLGFRPGRGPEGLGWVWGAAAARRSYTMSTEALLLHFAPPLGADVCLKYAIILA